MKCKYWDCGFCYAPVDVETNATQGGCFEPEYCPYRKSQMTNPEIIVEQKKYGSAMDYTMKVFQRLDEDTVKIDGVEYKKVKPPKPQTLFEIIREWCDDDDQPTCEELVNKIEREWLPNEGCHELNSNDYCEGWNDCIEHLKENLK
jgi:hypothetical protein